MKIENYRKEDIFEAIEQKNLMIHELDKLDLHFWTDDVQRAKQSIVELYEGICELEKLQTRKALEDLVVGLSSKGIKARILVKRKTD